MSIFSTIICCVNLTENNDEIVRYSKQVTNKDAKILLVHIMPSIASMKNLAPTIDSFFKEALISLENNLQEYREKFFAEYSDVEIRIVKGTPAPEILKLVDEKCAEIIVMGSQSSKHWFQFTMADPTHAIASKTRIPVLLIPNDLNLECFMEE